MQIIGKANDHRHIAVLTDAEVDKLKNGDISLQGILDALAERYPQTSATEITVENDWRLYRIRRNGDEILVFDEATFGNRTTRDLVLHLVLDSSGGVSFDPAWLGALRTKVDQFRQWRMLIRETTGDPEENEFWNPLVHHGHELPASVLTDQEMRDHLRGIADGSVKLYNFGKKRQEKLAAMLNDRQQ